MGRQCYFLLPTDPRRAVARWEVVAIPCHADDGIRPQGLSNQNQNIGTHFLKTVTGAKGLERLAVESITECTFHLVDTVCDNGRESNTLLSYGRLRSSWIGS